jgi:hypothetical protein
MAKPALDDLYDIMRDGTAGIRNRLNAAISASRVERLAMPGEPEPPAVAFLRTIVAGQHAGLMFRHDYRRESASALAYWERRCKRAELQYDVADADERRDSWCKLVNGGIRLHLGKIGRWPQDKHVLLTAADEIDVTGLPDPDLVLSALLIGGHNRHARRRLRAIDERVPAVWSGSENERNALLRSLAKLVHQRLKEFGMAD